MTTERHELRDYLLGRLPEQPAQELDARLFADHTLLRELEDEQDLLIEDLHSGNLSTEEEALFRAQIARSPTLSERERSVRILQAALERQTLRPSRPALIRLANLMAPALAIVLCVVIYLYVGEYRKNAGLDAQLKALSPSHQAVSQPLGNLPAAVAFLAAKTVRGTSTIPEVALPANNSLLELQLELRGAPTGADNWDVEVLRGTDTIWSAHQLHARSVGSVRFLPLFIDSPSLQAGDYEVHYRPSTAVHESFQTRPFRIVI